MTVATHVTHCLPCIQTGVTVMTALISSAVMTAIGFGLGWYVKGRGMTGVQNDISNIKTDIVNLKNKIDPSAPAPVSATA